MLLLLLLLLLLLPALFDADDATVAVAVNILSPEMERVIEVSEWSDRKDCCPSILKVDALAL